MEVLLSPSLVLACGATIISFAPILVKCVDLSPTAVGFYRCAIGAIALLALSRRSGGRPRSAPASGSGAFWALCFVAGLIFAIDLAVWHRAVVWAGAGMGTILGNTQVFYMGLIGLVWHREALTARYAIAVPVAFVGVVLLVGVADGRGQGELYWWGVFMGLLTGIVYASYLVVMRKLEAVRAHRSTTLGLGLVTLFAGLGLLVLGSIEGTLRRIHASEFPWILLLGLGPQVLGWLLITRSLPAVPVSRSGLILLLQPLFAAILGAVLFQEYLSGLQILGGGLTLTAIYLGTTRSVGAANSSKQ